MIQNKKSPSFFIVGAMKSGTSSIHHMLNSHPDVFIPHPELRFFDCDDLFEVPDFFTHRNREWIYKDFEGDQEELLRWYHSFFQDATDSQLCGDDSPGYLVCASAASRIKDFCPHSKIIITLRDPSSRAFSHYLHSCRASRTSHSFETALKLEGQQFLSRSLYKDAVRRYLEVFGRSQVCFVLFEELVSDPEKELGRISEFLGLDAKRMQLGKETSHKNAARYPRSSLLLRLRNRALSKYRGAFYFDSHFPFSDEQKEKTKTPAFLKLLDAVHGRLNPLSKTAIPKMRAETREMLDLFFVKRNEGLSEMINRDCEKYWFKHDG
jgi:hypothetical protein